MSCWSNICRDRPTEPRLPLSTVRTYVYLYSVVALSHRPFPFLGDACFGPDDKAIEERDVAAAERTEWCHTYEGVSESIGKEESDVLSWALSKREQWTW